MPFSIQPGEAAGPAIKRMIREQIDRGLDEIEDSGLHLHETVHQLRKRCKKIRALLRLARGKANDNIAVYRQENARYRDAARELSDLRDTAALLETYDRLAGQFHDQADFVRLSPVRIVLERRRDSALSDDSDLESRVDRFRQRILAGRVALDEWRIGEGFEAMAPGLRRTYRRGRRAMQQAAAKPSPENLHEWRKRVKYHYYHVRVLEPVWKPVLERWRGEVKKLADDLGEDHDLAIFLRTLSAQPERFGIAGRDLQMLLEMADRRRKQLQTAAFLAGERLYAENAKHVINRFAAYWAAFNR